MFLFLLYPILFNILLTHTKNFCLFRIWMEFVFFPVQGILDYILRNVFIIDIRPDNDVVKPYLPRKIIGQAVALPRYCRFITAYYRRYCVFSQVSKSGFSRRVNLQLSGFEFVLVIIVFVGGGWCVETRHALFLRLRWPLSLHGGTWRSAFPAVFNFSKFPVYIIGDQLQNRRAVHLVVFHSISSCRNHNLYLHENNQRYIPH